MKKWYLLVAIAALTACSDKAEKQGSVHYAFTPKDSSFSKHIEPPQNYRRADGLDQAALSNPSFWR